MVLQQAMVFLFVLAAATSALLPAGAAAPSSPPAALAADDSCITADADSNCAWSALQTDRSKTRSIRTLPVSALLEVGASTRIDGVPCITTADVRRTLATKSDAAQFLHTGFFILESPLNKWPAYEKKLILAALSALATQPKFKVFYWTDVEPTNQVLQAVFKPVLSNNALASRFEIKYLNETDFDRVPNVGEKLFRQYRVDKELPSKSDVQRVVVLHNYGGIWFDADTLLVNDLSPLSGADWCYEGVGGFYNNALLAVSEPGSAFIKAYIQKIAAKTYTPGMNKIYQFGPATLAALHHESMSKSTFAVLPCCFFDGAWCGMKYSVYWDDFFSKPADADQVSYVTPGGRDLPYAYHWHNRWEKPIASGSLADVMYKKYITDLLVTL